MTEYIEREKLKEALCPYSDTNYAQDMDTILRIVDEFPAADVAPVVHGRWIKIDNPAYSPFDRSSPYLYLCDQCHEKEQSEKRFCPNCGAKMDLE